MDLQKYPFTRCERPHFVYNKYTHQRVSSQCGCCNSCNVARASRMTMLCNFEQEEHLFTYFVTLTYSEIYVPRLVVKQCGDEDIFALNNITPRLGDYGKAIGYDFDFQEHKRTWELIPLRSQTSVAGSIMYLSKRDCQNFLKRLRKYISKECDEKIRYYLCGEYGPKHLRPHYHCLFFFDSSKLAKVFESCLRKAWTFGRIDCQRASSNGVGSYVAQYVNSNCSLPEVYSLPALKPFTLHSRYFAQGYYKSKREEIYETEPTEFIEHDRKCGDRIARVHAWRSLKTVFFPRCFRYRETTFVQHLEAYRLLLYARQIYKKASTLSSLASSITVDLADGVSNRVTDFLSDMLRYRDYTVDTIYSALNVSRHFFDFVCDEDYSYTKSLIMCRKIEEFYNVADMIQLKNWYQSQCDYVTAYRDTRALVNYYDNIFVADNNPEPFYDDKVMRFLASLCIDEHHPLTYDDLLQQLSLYRDYKCNNLARAEKSIKHKKQNDSLKNWFKFFKYYSIN